MPREFARLHRKDKREDMHAVTVSNSIHPCQRFLKTRFLCIARRGQAVYFFLRRQVESALLRDCVAVSDLPDKKLVEIPGGSTPLECLRFKVVDNLSPSFIRSLH